MSKKRLRIALGVTLILITSCSLGFYSWSRNVRPAMPAALHALESDSKVKISTHPWLIFEPVGGTPSTGFILYPGGLVDPKAYAPMARDISAAGYLVVIPPMPLNLAMLNKNAAGEIIGAYPEIAYWGIGGHSLGGSMAASFSRQNLDIIAGLVLWASYPAKSDDLSETALSAISIYGTLDGVAEPEEILAGRDLLPGSTTWVPIYGGNHAQFGWYGSQDGDNPPEISREDQSSQIVAATVEILQKISR